jgi:hypothetical protein
MHPTQGLVIANTRHTTSQDHTFALINYEDDYVQPLIMSAMHELFPEQLWALLKPPAAGSDVSLADLIPSTASKVMQITPYETIDFDYAATHPESCLINSYMIRKALIRKHFLSATVETWVAKHPESILKTHVKRSEAFEVDYAEFLDDSLVEAFELRASLERNSRTDGEEGIHDGGSVDAAHREWWILKPGMSDRGQGIRLFSTMDELQTIFDEWEAELPDSDDEEDGGNDEGGGVDDGDARPGREVDKDYITTSHLRHFIVQPYIDPPLLLDNRKFHIRTYVLAVGSLRVYVYKHMLALFAAKPYNPPWKMDDGTGANIDLDAHLTNTCLQGPEARADSVARFWDLPLPPLAGRDSPHDFIFSQICQVTGEVFEAAARGMMVHFQPLANAFEVFGLDFLVDAAGTTWLLEINAFPDFKQTGDDPSLRDIVGGFWADVLRLAAGPFMASSSNRLSDADGHHCENDKLQVDDMVPVRDVDLGRR